MGIPRFLKTIEVAPAALGLCGGLLMGLGRPGIDLPAGSLLGLVLQCAAAARAPNLGSALLVALVAGAAWMPVTTIGSVSWGAWVPAMLVGIGYVLYGLPITLWTYWAGRRFSRGWLWLASLAFWTLCIEAGELARYPIKTIVSSLAISWPWLLGGARLLGADVLCAIASASSVVAGVELARAGFKAGMKRALLALGGGFFVLVGLALLARATAPSDTRSIRAGVPQIDADSGYYLSRLTSPRTEAQFGQRLTALLGALERDVDLLVLPEAFDGKFSLMLASELERWQDLARARSQAVLLTSYMVEPSGRKSNAAGAIDRAGMLVGIHRKVDLAPVGEDPLVAGVDYEPLALGPGLNVGVMICQEGYLGRASRVLARRGATLLIGTTSDTTFKSSALVFEHLAKTQLRAIETGRAIVWASNAGPSGGIDRWGKFEGGVFRRPAAVRVEAQLYSDTTPFLRLEPALPVLSLVLLLVSWAFGRTRPEPAPVLPPPSRRTLAFAIAGLVLAPALWFGSPALVALRHGRADEAWAAPADLFAPPLTRFDPGALERYRGSADGLDGALAYFLAYYGIDVQARTLARPLPAPELGAIADYLKTRYRLGSKVVELDPKHAEPPRIAALARLKGGSFCVIDHPGGDSVQVFLPRTASGKELPLSELPRVLRDRLIIPQRLP